MNFHRAAAPILTTLAISTACTTEEQSATDSSDLAAEFAADMADLEARGIDLETFGKAEHDFAVEEAKTSACTIAATAGAIATAAAYIMEGSAAATATCAGVMAMTGAGEVLCLLPAAGTALSGLTTAVASVAAGTATLVCASELAGVKIAKIVDVLEGLPNLDFPPNCTASQYLWRTAAKRYWCKTQGGYSCKARPILCAKVRSNIANATACAAARKAHNACYPNGGDKGHKDKLEDVLLNIQSCIAATAVCQP